MANAIITIDRSFTSENRSKIQLVPQNKEIFMAWSQLRDVVTAKERLRTPFAFRWLKFKTGFFGRVLKKGDVR